MFTEPDAWAGGFFGLDLELGPRDDHRLRDALFALWAHPTLDGCFLQNDREPSRQTRVDPGSQLIGNRLYGVATIPAGRDVACCSFAVRLDEGVDWLYFAIPMGSLTTVCGAGAYPVNDGMHPGWIGYLWLEDGALRWSPPNILKAPISVKGDEPRS